MSIPTHGQFHDTSAGPHRPGECGECDRERTARLETLETENKDLKLAVAIWEGSLKTAERIDENRRAEVERLRGALEQIASHGPECDHTCAPDMLSIARNALHPETQP